MIGNVVRMTFEFQIDSAEVTLQNANLFRLYELLRSTAEVWSHDGFHITSTECLNQSSGAPAGEEGQGR